MDQLTLDILTKNDALKSIHDKIDKIEFWDKLPKEPMVTVCMATYNHEKFIAEALGGILMQQVDFDYEIIIKEDCSTDNTRKILLEYQNLHPDKIRLWLCKENLYSQKQSPKVRLFARGKYSASCEGDDYWTDPLKLQKQVDFLEANPEYVLCFHDCKLLRNNKPAENILGKYNYNSNQEISPIEFQKWIAQTATIVYRNKQEILNIASSFKHVVFGDILFRRIIVDFGKIYLINEVMSVYRKHEGGISNAKFSNNKRDFDKINQFKEMYSYFGDKWLTQPIAKSYYFISKRFFKEREIFSAIKYLFIALAYNPKDIFKKIKNDIIKTR